MSGLEVSDPFKSTDPDGFNGTEGMAGFTGKDEMTGSEIDPIGLAEIWRFSGPEGLERTGAFCLKGPEGLEGIF